MIPVDSSNLVAYDYDVATGTFAVQFHSGKVIHYHHVSPTTVSEFRAAKSKGEYFERRVKHYHTATLHKGKT
jgi:hypothetical protein